MNKVQLPLERHPSLPAGMDAEQLAEWLRSSAVEVFTSSKETPLTPEEISGYEKEAVTSGREINRLEDLLAMVREHVKKGSSEKVRLVLPATIGIKNLSSVRRENEDMVERGAIVDEMQLFGIPNTQTEMMEYFDIEGNIIEDRTRTLTPKEKHTHIGMFQNVRDRNARAAGADENGEISGSKAV